MQVRTALTTIAWRAAVSAIAGLLVSAFAAAALTFGAGASGDRLAVGRTISDALAPLFSAVAGAGLIATVVVFACLVMNDALRAAGRWLEAQRRWFIAALRAITWLGARIAWVVARIGLAIVVALQYVAGSTVVVEAVWLARIVGRAMGSMLVGLMIIGGFAAAYIGLIVVSLSSITESTAMVVAILDDPPRTLAMALGFGGAAALMYIGVGALALCLWLPYYMIRAGQRRAMRRLNTPSRPDAIRIGGEGD
ncbi:MAG TPA: hypothetical protein VIS26_03905 [Candidatus Limnocylindria bacterium]|jgi:hypothetical protein